MIDLFDVATLSNTTPFIDTYGLNVVYGNLSLFSDSIRSGNTSRRRVLKFAPEVALPDQMTLTDGLSGTVFILAPPIYDNYQGAIIRVKCPVLEGQLAYITNVNNILTSVTGTLTYVNISYLKRVGFEDTSEFLTGTLLYYSNYFSINYDNIIKVGSSYYKAKSDGRLDDLGLSVVEATLLDSPLQTATIVTKGAYDPVTNTTPETTLSSVPIFVEHATLDFANENRSFKKIEDGDKAISVSKSDATVTIDTVIGSYRIISVTDKNTYWLCHCRV